MWRWLLLLSVAGCGRVYTGDEAREVERTEAGDLVQLTDEPPGENCLEGGTRIEIGED